MVVGYVSLLYSISERPLEYWRKQHSQTGRIRKMLDSDLIENVVEIQDLDPHNAHNTFIACPSYSQQLLDIKLPFLVIILKNLNVECRFKVQVIDDKGVRHLFHFSNANVTKESRDYFASRVKLKLEPGWNKLELDLRSLNENAFKCRYAATQRLEVCANCRLRRIYFTDRHYEDYEMCSELCQNFLDFYMLKWGIHKVNNATQTCCLKFKQTVGTDNQLKRYDGNLSSNIVLCNSVVKGASKTNSFVEKFSSKVKNIDDEFLRKLEVKSNQLINNFFRWQTTKLPHSLNYKKQITMKTYVVRPINSQQQKCRPKKIIFIQKKTENENTHKQPYFNTTEEIKNPIHALQLPINSHCPKEEQGVVASMLKQNNVSPLAKLTDQMTSIVSALKIDVNNSTISYARNGISTVSTHENGDHDSCNKLLDDKSTLRYKIGRHELRSLHNKVFNLNKKYIIENVSANQLHLKRDNLVEKTVFDLKRVYMNFLNKDKVAKVMNQCE